MAEYMLDRAQTFPQGRHPIFEAGRGDKGVLRGMGAEIMNAGAVLSWPPNNVWLGVSCENRKHGLARLDHLRRTPAVVRFVSFEPLLEDLGEIDLSGIHWAIVGGESGPGARPCGFAWIRSIRDQCRAAGVPVFIKQLGAQPRTDADEIVPRLDRKGGDMAEWPDDLQIREFPDVEAVR